MIVCKDRFVDIMLEGAPATVDARAFHIICGLAFPGCVVTLRGNGQEILKHTPKPTPPPGRST